MCSPGPDHGARPGLSQPLRPRHLPVSNHHLRRPVAPRWKPRARGSTTPAPHAIPTVIRTRQALVRFAPRAGGTCHFRRHRLVALVGSTSLRTPGDLGSRAATHARMPGAAAPPSSNAGAVGATSAVTPLRARPVRTRERGGSHAHMAPSSFVPPRMVWRRRATRMLNTLAINNTFAKIGGLERAAVVAREESG